MAKKPETQEGARSMKDIAATLVGKQTPAGEAADDVELGEDAGVLDQVLGAKEREDADDTDDEEDEDQSPTGGENEDEDQEEGNDDDDDASDDDVDENAGDNEPEYLDIRDDDLITVTVDNEDRELTIGELKKAYSAEGAIDKRLQDATEARKAAMSDATQMLEMLAAQEASLAEALNGLDDNLFKGMIPTPDEKLKSTDPQRYLRHKDAYDAEQKRIAEGKTAIQAKIKEVSEARASRLQEFAQQAATVIAREIPELVDQKTAAQTYQNMAQTAMQYGYTEAEIQNAVDPRMFMLVRDAMRYRQMNDKARERDPKDLAKQGEKRVRRLRSGNTTAKNRVRQADKQRKAVSDRARETGKVKDVAATLLVSKKG